MTQLLALAGFGFLLGMRHATDADHVIAVTTILNRSRRFAHTTLIGALWASATPSRSSRWACSSSCSTS